MKYIWNNSYIWTAVVDQSEEWSSQKIFQFKQLERRSLKKSRLQRDFFRLLLSNCLNWKIFCDDHSSLWTGPVKTIQIFAKNYSILRDFYFKVILPSVKYRLVPWGACCNLNLLDSIERLNCRAYRIILNLPRDITSKEVLAYDRLPIIFLYYKIGIFKIFSKAHNDSLPELLPNNISIKSRNGCSLRGGDCLSVPRFETRFTKDSLAYRGTVLLNTISLNENGISHLSNKDRNLI